MTARFRKGMYVAIVALTLCTLYLIFDSVTDRLSNAEVRAEKTNRALDQANSKVSALGEQVRGLGERPVVSTAPVETPRITQGPTGLTGPRGPIGPQGVAGKDGAVGAAGAVGATGAAGPKGETGPKGDTGATGPSGEDGKDGSNGSDGAAGPAGADGRGVSSISCSGLLATFTITYSDGSTEQVSCGG